ncbi:MAG TPA: hypothetical protein VIY53_14585, partial [Acidobacteriaceae bacterium]
SSNFGIVKRPKGTTKVRDNSNPLYAHIVDSINSLTADEELPIPVPEGKDAKKYLAYMRTILKAKARRDSIKSEYTVRTSSDGKFLVIWLEPEEADEQQESAGA